MSTVAELLRAASGRVARTDARILLSSVLDAPKESFIAHPEREVSDADERRFLSILEKAAAGCPIPYLTGLQAFWSRDFLVTSAVLIPRPDTETVVETALSLMGSVPNPRILELGTGSGCIAVTIALERPDATVHATDASPEALAVAKQNAERLDAARIRFSLGNWLEAVPADALYDLIVSNPPYIEPGDEHLEALKYEPIDALTDGVDGLSDIREIASNARSHLTPGGYLVLEHGYDQGEAVRSILQACGFASCRTVRDLGGNERCTVGQNPA